MSQVLLQDGYFHSGVLSLLKGDVKRFAVILPLEVGDLMIQYLVSLSPGHRPYRTGRVPAAAAAGSAIPSLPVPKIESQPLK